jgi:hypothetical protein
MTLRMTTKDTVAGGKVGDYWSSTELTPVKRRKTVAIVALSCIIVWSVVWSVSLALIHASPEWQRYRQYMSLRYGMTEAEVIAHLDGSPDHVCVMGGWRVLMYFGRSEHASRPQPGTLPTEVAQSHDIPYAYEAVQLLVNPNGRFVAQTCNGESSVIYTIDGEVDGDHLSLVEDAFWRRNK